MDIINTTRPAPFGAVTITVVTNIVNNTSSAVIAAFKAHQTRVALSKLSTRQLLDIGLTQADITRASRNKTLLH